MEFRADDNKGGEGGVLHVSWDALSDEERIQDYVVKVNPAPVDGGRTDWTFPASRTSATWGTGSLPALTNGQEYSFTVRARRSTGDPGEWSNAGTGIPAGIPGPARNVTAFNNEATTDTLGVADVYWDRPASTNGAEVHYTVEYMYGYWSGIEFVSDKTEDDVPSPQRGRAHVEMDELSIYQVSTFRVRAINKAGPSRDWAYSGGIMMNPRPVLTSASILPFNESIEVFNVEGSGLFWWRNEVNVGSGWIPVPDITEGETMGLVNGRTYADVQVRVCNIWKDRQGDPDACSLPIQAVNGTTGSPSVTPFGPPVVVTPAVVDGSTVTWTWAAQRDTTTAIDESSLPPGATVVSSATGATVTFPASSGAEVTVVVTATGQGVHQSTPATAILGP